MDENWQAKVYLLVIDNKNYGLKYMNWMHLSPLIHEGQTYFLNKSFKKYITDGQVVLSSQVKWHFCIIEKKCSIKKREEATP